MKLYEYKPELMVEGKGGKQTPVFDGSIKIEIPLYKERLAIIKDLSLKKADDISSDDLKKADDTSIDDVTKILDHVEKRVKSVDLTHKSSKTKIKSLDELGYYKEGVDIINKLGAMLVSGAYLGN